MHPLESGGIYGRLKTWASRPLNENLDPINLALIVILILTVTFLWSRVLSHITEI